MIKGKQDYYFLCETKPTRHGFAHIVELFNPSGCMIARAKNNYLNRTWERYEYESTMMAAAKNCDKTDIMPEI